MNLFQPSLTFAKTGDALSKIGDPMTYTLTLENTSSDDAPALVCRITDALLGLDESVTLASTAGPYVLTRPFTVPPGAPDPLVNTAHVTCSPVGFPNVLTATDSHTVELFQPSVQVEKSGPAEAHPGDAIVYTFRITNTGSADSPNLILDAVTDVGVGWPGLGDLTALAAANGCTPLVPGAACTFDVPYTIPLGTPDGDWRNTVSVRYHPLSFPNQITDTDDHTLAITGAVDIVVIKDDNVGPILTNTLKIPTQATAMAAFLNAAGVMAPQAPFHREFVFAGDLITYPIAICNQGELTATHIVMTETIPVYTTYVERGFGWTHVITRVFSLPVGTLAPGECRLYYMTVRVDDVIPPDLTNLDNLVCGFAVETEMYPPDNCNHEDTPVRQRPEITKTVGGLSVVGTQSLYTFTIAYHNPDPAPFVGVRITDTLPPDMVWHSDTALDHGWTQRTVLLTEVGWYTPTLAAYAEGRFVLTLRVVNTDTSLCGQVLTNSVLMTVLNNGVDYFADRDTVTFTFECPTDLAVIKNDDVGPVTPLPRLADGSANPLEQFRRAPDEAAPLSVQAVTAYREFVYEGDIVTYTIVAYNRGPYPATNVVLTETLPLHTDYVGYNWTHGGGRRYTLPIGNLAVGAFFETVFVVRVHDPVTETITAVYNRVCVGGAELDPDLSNNCWDEDTPVRVRSLRISKTAPICIAPGDTFDYTPYYTNTNQSQAFTNVHITDTLPAPVSFAGTPNPWFCTGRNCNMIVPSIPAGASNVTGPLLRVTLDPLYTGRFITNVIAIENGNVFTLVTELDTGPDLVVVKNDNVGPLPRQAQAQWDEVHRELYGVAPQPLQALAQPLFVMPGDRITYTILYLNSGIDIAHNVVITERLPDHTRYVGGGWTLADMPYYTIAVGDLAPHMGGELHFIVEVLDPLACGVDEILNLVTIAGDDIECDYTNNSSNDDTPVQTDSLLYVAGHHSDTIDVFRTSDFSYVRSFDAGPMPFGMVQVDDSLYVVNSGVHADPNAPGGVSVVNLDTHTIVRTLTAGHGSLMATALDGYVYVTNHSCCGEGITVISHATGQVVARVNPTGAGIADWSYFGITPDPQRGLLYTTKRYMGGEGLWTLSAYPDLVLTWRVDTRPPSNALLSLPYQTVYNPRTDHIYVTFPHLNELRIYTPETFTLFGVYPTQQQAVSSTDPGSTDGGKGLDDLEYCVYNANFAARSVTVLTEGPCVSSAYALLATPLPSGGTAILPPPGTIILPRGGIYLPLIGRNFQPADNPVINFARIDQHIPVSGRPKGLVAGDGCVYVTLPEENRVAVIDARTQTVIHEIPTYGDYPINAILVNRTQ